MVVVVVAAISNNTAMIKNEGKEKNKDTTTSHLHPRQDMHPPHLPIMSLHYAVLTT